VYTWGKNDHEQIARKVVGKQSTAILNDSVKRVKHELEKKNVVHIACGEKFNMVVTDENKLYGWGMNDKGQISIVHSQERYVYPHEITTFLDKIGNFLCLRFFFSKKVAVSYILILAFQLN